MTRLALRSVLIALMACGSTPPAIVSPPPNRAESEATPPPDPVAAPVPVAAGPPVMPAELLVRPPVPGTGNLLFMGASARVDTFTVTFARSAHKQVGRITTGLFDFVITKGGKKVNLHLETDQQKFQAEMVAHGALFVFEQRSDDVFTVMLAAAAAPPLLEEPACIVLIDQAARRAGIIDIRSAAMTEEGILRVRRDAWTAYCGRYTKRVWFSPGAGAADGATP